MRWLLTRPASQLSFFLNELLFLMGSSKKERKSWRPWGGCERRLSNERSELINRALQGLSWMSWLRLMEWIAARLWAVAPPMAPPQERTSTNSTNNSNSTMKFNNEWRGMNAASACFEWNQFIDEMRDKRAASEWAGMTNQAEARQAHSATLLFVGPQCALKKEDNCWNGLWAANGQLLAAGETPAGTFQSKIEW